MFKRILTPALVFGMAALAPPAAAQTICGPRLAIANWLTSSFSEARTAVGLIGQDRALELWVAEDTHSWTILVTRPDSISCVVASGTNWTALKPDGELASESRRFSRHD
ncbi:hypothetical protein [Roseinatronobacter alkalisoli]|uniref:Uncharacterized protein n=1 Tax=Roseinatronobacter alkalisoli TaxID=3028235 RepID=A0ABT5TFF8_9RHOB|nr:hypothetical protein [Roseinatronobacter sp. HJB301]MDD7973746.1 hypothetical protein [Roseinatronobacter sp. HJB301]